MTTISSDLEEGRRSKLGLFDLPREIRDQIYGYLIKDTYTIIPAQLFQKNQGDDFRHLSILRVSKRANFEAMQVLQRRSWFNYHMPIRQSPTWFIDNAPTRHMKNVQIVLDQDAFSQDLSSLFLNIAGTTPLRRTCIIHIPDFNLCLLSQKDPQWTWLGLYLECIKLLTGFKTVVVQVNSSRFNNIQRSRYDEEIKLLVNMVKSLETALGPAISCDSVHEEKYNLNFKFSPRQFAAEQRKLAAKQRQLAGERRPPITFEDQRWHKKG